MIQELKNYKIMKKLFLGAGIGILTLMFSAFTTIQRGQFSGQLFALLSDGNYHQLTAYDPGNCIYHAGTKCVYQYVPGGGPAKTVYTVAEFNYWVSQGTFAPYGTNNSIYLDE